MTPNSLDHALTTLRNTRTLPSGEKCIATGQRHGLVFVPMVTPTVHRESDEAPDAELDRQRAWSEGSNASKCWPTRPAASSQFCSRYCGPEMNLMVIAALTAFAVHRSRAAVAISEAATSAPEEAVPHHRKYPAQRPLLGKPPAQTRPTVPLAAI